MSSDERYLHHDPFNSACPCQKCSNQFWHGRWVWDRDLHRPMLAPTAEQYASFSNHAATREIRGD